MAIAQTGLNTKINDDVYKPDASGYNTLGNTLAHLLGIKQTGQNASNLSKQEADQKDQAQLNTISRLPDLLKKSGPGGKAALGPDSASIDQGATERLIAEQMKAQAAGVKNQEGAVKDAIKSYESRSKELQPMVDAVSTGLHALKNNDPMAGGQIIAAVMGAGGFKRFNTPEGQKISPDSFDEKESTFLQKIGIDPKSWGAQGIPDVQRKALIRYFNGKLDDLQDHNNALKQEALGQFGGSAYASPDKLQQLQSTLGAGLDGRLSQVKSGFDHLHSEVVAQTPDVTPQTGFMGGVQNALSNLFHPSPKAPTAPAPAPTGVPARAPQAAPGSPIGSPLPPQSNSAPPGAQPPQPGLQPPPAGPIGFDPNAYLKGR